MAGSKKNKGRPKVRAADRHEVQVKVLVTPAEGEEIQKAAEGAGASRSTWARMALLRAARETDKK